VSARGPKDSGSERAAAGAREGRESDEENLTLSVDTQVGKLPSESAE